MGYGPMIRGHQTALKKQPFQAPGSVDILDPLDPKKGKKQRSLTDSIPNKDSFFYVGFFIIIIYILHNIIYYHHFLLFPSLLYILHIIISVATDTETTTEFATIVRLLRLFITSPDVGFAHRMVEHG